MRCARCAAIEPVSCMATPGHVRPLPEARGPRPPQADARARLAVCSVITFALFWVLLFAAYACDRDLFRPKKPIAPEDDFEGGAVPGSLVEAGADASDDITVKNALKMGGGMSGLDDMNDDAKVDVILESLKPVTAATHTRNAMSWCVPLPLARLACSPQRGVCSLGGSHRLICSGWRPQAHWQEAAPRLQQGDRRDQRDWQGRWHRLGLRGEAGKRKQFGSPS